MAEVKARTVTVGGEPRVLARFKSYKATLALDIMAGVTDQVRVLLRTVGVQRRQWAEDNPVRITRSMCMERAADFVQLADEQDKRASTAEKLDEAQEAEALAASFRSRAATWERQLADMGDKDYIELPGQMPEEEEILVALPEALKMRVQFTQLIGLALIPDERLRDCWLDEDIDQILLEHGNGLLTEFELGEEIELIVAIRALLEEQLRPRKGAIEQLRSLREWWKPTQTDEQTEEQTEGATADTPPPEGQEFKTSSTDHPESVDEPTSSTSSEEPTDGTGSESSLASRTT